MTFKEKPFKLISLVYIFLFQIWFVLQYYILLLKSNMDGRKKSEELKRLSTESLNINAKNAWENVHFECHKNTVHHKNCNRFFPDLKKIYLNSEIVVANVIDYHHNKQIKDNREKLKSLVELIIFFSRKYIVFRGHKDDGNIRLSTNPKTE